MRGSNLLFNDIFTIEAPAKQRRGRSETFDTDRNLCLIHRYQYFGSVTGWRYELLLKVISRDFWISEVTVGNILTLNHHLLVNARKAALSKKDLQKKWPQLSWETPTLSQYNILQN